ncbi:hypothetical protein [Desulfobotulus sp.]|uniref:hypothetical protein n=1 Tax=Desulfobotulus sp. TaxID=1940337 RepID=UPI002A35BD55|nr:hypothetical protein [Desulfobotulus sp.]MDY0162496.1 hypothetical protein [Desulfobotulus sp.]
MRWKVPFAFLCFALPAIVLFGGYPGSVSPKNHAQASEAPKKKQTAPEHTPDDQDHAITTENYSSQALEAFVQQFNEMFGITDTLRTQLLAAQEAYTPEQNQAYALPYILDFISDQNQIYAGGQFIKLTQNPQLLQEMYQRVAVYLRTGMDIITRQYVVSLDLTPYLTSDLSLFPDQGKESAEEKLARIIASGQVFKPDFLQHFTQALGIEIQKDTEVEESACVISALASSQDPTTGTAPYTTKTCYPDIRHIISPYSWYAEINQCFHGAIVCLTNDYILGDAAFRLGVRLKSLESSVNGLDEKIEEAEKAIRDYQILMTFRGLSAIAGGAGTGNPIGIGLGLGNALVSFGKALTAGQEPDAFSSEAIRIGASGLSGAPAGAAGELTSAMMTYGGSAYNVGLSHVQTLTLDFLENHLQEKFKNLPQHMQEKAKTLLEQKEFLESIQRRGIDPAQLQIPSRPPLHDPGCWLLPAWYTKKG